MFAKAIVDSGLKKHRFTSDNITPFQMKKIINEEILPKLVKFMKGVETLEALGVGQIIFDVKKNILFINASFKRLVGLSEAVESKDVIAKAELEDIIDSILKGEKENIVKETELKTSKLRLNIIGGPVKNAQKEITGVVFFFQDNTMRAALDMEMDHVYEKLEEKNAKLNEAISKLESTGKQLRQSEKMAAVGQLAGGVAHEINNPLTGVLTFTHMLLRRKDLNEEVRSDLQTVARETERVRKIVKGLLDFSRQTKLEPELTDVNGLIRSVLTLVENQALIKGVGLNFRQGEGLPMYIMDRNQMKSAVLNIIINAIDATEPGGNITITTGLSMSIDKTGQKGIEMSVMDTGCGIPLENLDKLLDPFFTTKKVGEGTGLGLSVSSGIVERHGGIIRIQSDVGRGSIFTIWLPLKEHEKIEGKNK